jgi:DNA-binding beta-propeller fold protein YncE
VGKVDLGNKGSLPSGIVFTHNGKTALLTRGGDNMVSVLRIDGSNVPLDPRPITTGLAPYTMDINGAGTDGRKLTPGKSLKTENAGPESFATAWP